MGWKNVKEHYRIEHIVHVTQEGICIGSPYVTNIIVIRNDGIVTKWNDKITNDDLCRYLAEMLADPQRVKELIQSPDTFSASIPVYTYEDATIIEKQCECLGWPNVTHDGQLMHDNTFFPTKNQAVYRAKRNAHAGIEHFSRSVQKLKEDLAQAEQYLTDTQANLAQLNADYPDITVKTQQPEDE